MHKIGNKGTFYSGEKGTKKIGVDRVTAMAVLWGWVGLCGIAYAVVIARRMSVQKAYQPVFEDWLFHVLLPCAAYTVLAMAAYLALSHIRPALFCSGGAALTLLFIGIHNAWDAVTYHIFGGNIRR